MKHRWIIILCILGAIPIVCFAAGRNGYIRLKMAYNGNPIAGGTVTLYNVSDFSAGSKPEELEAYVKTNKIPGQTKEVDKTGTVVFEDLLPGQYLLLQQKAAKGFYPMKPFSVFLNESTEDGLLTGVDASPKLKPEGKLPQTGQLVWPAWVMLSSGVLLVGVGIICQKKR